MPNWKDYIELGLKALQEGDGQTSDLYFTLAYDEGPKDDPTPPFLLGWRMARTDRLKSAEKYLREAWERDSEHLPAVCEWARVIARLGRIDEAMARIHDEKLRHPTSVMVYLTESELLMLSGDHGRALDVLYIAREAGATDDEYSEGLAKIYHAQAVQHMKHGELDDAYRLLLRVTELLPTWSSPYVNLGHLAHIRGALEEAEVLYRKALELDPYNPVALYNLASLYIRMGELNEAKELVTQLLNEHKSYPGIAELVDELVKGVSDGRGENS